MNGPDRSDADLLQAFQRRIDASPVPPAAMFDRTMAAIDAGTESRRRQLRWHSAKRWWRALAAPARLATAAAIVVLLGTLGFGAVRITRELAVAVRPIDSSTITLDRRGPSAVPRVARAATMRVAVRDVSQALRGIAHVASREQGSILARSAAANGAASLTLRVRASRLETTMRDIAALGTVRTSRVRTVDVSAALTDVDSRIRRAQGAMNLATPASHAREVIGLLEKRRRLAASVANSTLAVTFLSVGAKSPAIVLRLYVPAEPWRTNPRQTGNPLARGAALATTTSITVYRPRPLRRAPRFASVPDPKSARIAT